MSGPTTSVPIIDLLTGGKETKKTIRGLTGGEDPNQTGENRTDLTKPPDTEEVKRQLLAGRREFANDSFFDVNTRKNLLNELEAGKITDTELADRIKKLKDPNTDEGKQYQARLDKLQELQDKPLQALSRARRGSGSGGSGETILSGRGYSSGRLSKSSVLG